MFFPWIVFAVLLLAIDAGAIKGDSYCSAMMCVNASVNQTAFTYALVSNLGEDTFGWMAVGFGSKMAGTPMIIVWPNKDGSLTISHRLADAHAEPKLVDAPPVRASVYPQISSQSAEETVIAFTIPPSSDTKQSIIWAMGTTRPPSSSPDARLAKHIASGSAVLDLTKELLGPGTPTISSGPPDPSGTVTFGRPTATGKIKTPPPFTLPDLLPYQRLLIGHAVLCSLGFLVLLPLGALSARLLRTFTPKWFKIHWIFQAAIASPLILVGFALAVVAMVEKEGNHFDDPHKVSGLVLLVLYVLQLVFGTFIHWFKPARRPTAPSGILSEKSLVYSRHSLTLRPLQNYLHPIFGLVIFGLAFYTSRQGFVVEWPQSTGRGENTPTLSIIWLVWLLLLIISYLGGLALLPRQFVREWRTAQNRTRGGNLPLKLTNSSPTSTKSAAHHIFNGGKSDRYQEQNRPGSPDSFDGFTEESQNPPYANRI